MFFSLLTKGRGLKVLLVNRGNRDRGPYPVKLATPFSHRREASPWLYSDRSETRSPPRGGRHAQAPTNPTPEGFASDRAMEARLGGRG